ncbi:MAG: TIGR04255 family protein [Proteobacteria bacterium]|nr:TIGR04255 family protein [Pseudomonadota bacterium]
MPARKTVTRLTNSPLVLVLSQVRFAAILDLADRIPAFQRDLKALGFPRFEEVHIPRLKSLDNSGPQIELTKQWHFLSANRAEGFVLSQDFITYLTGSYHTFEHFLARFLTVVRRSDEWGTLELVDRVGLRYVDLIQPKPGEGIEDYVLPSLLGVPLSVTAPLGAKRTSLASETTFDTPDGTLVVRLRQLAQGAVTPPDLQPELLRLQKSVGRDESAYALDTDFFAADLEKAADIHLLEDTLWRLHAGAHLAFEGSVSPHALQAWGPVEEITL